jgi:hypothetical protein
MSTTNAYAGEEAEAARRTGAYADNGNSNGSDSEQQYQDETRPVSTPGSGVNVNEAEKELDELQERLREEQRK